MSQLLARRILEKTRSISVPVIAPPRVLRYPCPRRSNLRSLTTGFFRKTSWCSNGGARGEKPFWKVPEKIVTAVAAEAETSCHSTTRHVAHTQPLRYLARALWREHMCGCHASQCTGIYFIPPFLFPLLTGWMPVQHRYTLWLRQLHTQP